MKKFALAAVMAATASTALAGGLAEPIMEAPVVEAATGTSAGGILVPVLLLLLIAAAVASD